MFEIQGRYTSARLYADIYDEKLLDQVRRLLDMPYLKDCPVAMMPDCHMGEGAAIGTTIRLGKAIAPDLVGVDIGCGMTLLKLPVKKIDYVFLDQIIRRDVPSGLNVRERPIADFPGLQELRHYPRVEPFLDRVLCSLGTLGGGNHFIEIDHDKEGNLYLLIHSGSRYLGTLINRLYVDLATKNHIQEVKDLPGQRLLIERLKAEGRKKEIQNALRDYTKERMKSDTMPKELYPVSGPDFEDYCHDVAIVTRFASENRKQIARSILSGLGIPFENCEFHECSHNTIDKEDHILRKGAIRAHEGDFCIIPISMKDGALLGYGKGNKEANESCPHGAGRRFSRKEAKERITLQEFQDSMKGIYSTSVREETIDESPFAYKPLDSILKNIQDCCTITDRILPTYNFKAC